MQRARYRSRGHAQNVHVVFEHLDLLLVLHSETLFFVQNEQAEIFENDVFPEQSVRGDDNARFARFYAVEDALYPLSGHQTRQKVYLYTERREAFGKSIVVLLTKYRGGRKERRLLAFDDGLEYGAHRDFGLSEAHVAAQQAVHDLALFHILFYLRYRYELIVRFVVREIVLEFFLPDGVGGIFISFGAEPFFVKGYEIGGHFLHRTAHALLDALEFLTAELIELRRAPAGVLVHFVEAVGGKIEPVAPSVKDTIVILSAHRGGERHEPFAHAYPVSLVNDVIPLLGHYERLPLTRRALSRRCGAPHDVVGAYHAQLRRGQHESARKPLGYYYDGIVVLGIGGDPYPYVALAEKFRKRFRRTLVARIDQCLRTADTKISHVRGERLVIGAVARERKRLQAEYRLRLEYGVSRGDLLKA